MDEVPTTTARRVLDYNFTTRQPRMIERDLGPNWGYTPMRQWFRENPNRVVLERNPYTNPEILQAIPGWTVNNLDSAAATIQNFQRQRNNPEMRAPRRETMQLAIQIYGEYIREKALERSRKENERIKGPRGNEIPEYESVVSQTGIDHTFDGVYF